MRRVLLIAYHFPPEPAAGALRPGYLASYLPEFGWDVTVLTRPLEGDHKQATGANILTANVLGQSFERSVRGALPSENGARNGTVSPLRRALRWVKRTALFPDPAAGWLLPAIARGRAAMRVKPFDAVLSTATPATVHVVGAAIALREHIPWIADYRDPWAGNPGVVRGPIRSVLEERLERSLIRRAAAVTTISDAIAGHLGRLHGRDVAVIPNGSEPRDWDGMDAIAPSGFRFCYTGSMFVEHRTPALLFEALAALRAEGHPAGNVGVDFFGPHSDHVNEQAIRCGIQTLVRQHGVVPRREALAAQRAASDLLIFLNMDPSAAYELGSKIIEYTRARRPILAFGPRNSVMREYLRGTSLGWFASDAQEAQQALIAAHQRYVAGELEVQPPSEAVFDARDLAKAFAAQLDAVV